MKTYDVTIRFWDDEDGEGEVTETVRASDADEAENVALDRAAEIHPWEEVLSVDVCET